MGSIIKSTGKAGKDDTALALGHADVFEAENVIVRWSVKPASGREIKGQASSGKVKLVYEGSHLSIYLTKSDLQSQRPPLALTEELSKLLGVHGTGMDLLFQHVLMESDIAVLTSMLEEKGIALEDPITKTTEEEGNPGRWRGHQEGATDQNGQKNLESFVAEIDLIRSVEGAMNRAWPATQTDRMLSRACRLDGQDPAFFLPAQAIRNYETCGLGFPDDEITWSFGSFLDENHDWKKRHPGTDFVFEALYSPRLQTVFISSKNVHNVTEEIAFFGELAV